jgi:hypothetical protein
MLSFLRVITLVRKDVTQGGMFAEFFFAQMRGVVTTSTNEEFDNALKTFDERKADNE